MTFEAEPILSKMPGVSRAWFYLFTEPMIERCIIKNKKLFNVYNLNKLEEAYNKREKKLLASKHPNKFFHIERLKKRTKLLRRLVEKIHALHN